MTCKFLEGAGLKTRSDHSDIFANCIRYTSARLALAVSAVLAGISASGAQQTYSEICDASAAVAIGEAHVLVAHDEAFDDEGDVLYLYRNDGRDLADGQAEPLKTFSLKDHLQVHGDKESDIEGAARVGDRVFWITSHGRNGKGKIKKNRYHLFATDITGSASETDVSFAGGYAGLAVDMQEPANWTSPDSELTKNTIDVLKASLQLDDEKKKRLRPKKDGLNIEGLAALPDGSGLLIGLRNPVPDGKALVLNLSNADDLVGGQADAARFAAPVLLDLGGRGIRSMDHVPAVDGFLIVAGPVNDESSFKLFKWSGDPEGKVDEVLEFRQSTGVNPEALVAYDDGKRIQILHDEGSRLAGGTECKKLSRKGRSFSDQWYVVNQ